MESLLASALNLAAAVIFATSAAPSLWQTQQHATVLSQHQSTLAPPSRTLKSKNKIIMPPRHIVHLCFVFSGMLVFSSLIWFNTWSNHHKHTVAAAAELATDSAARSKEEFLRRHTTNNNGGVGAGAQESEPPTADGHYYDTNRDEYYFMISDPRYQKRRIANYTSDGRTSESYLKNQAFLDRVYPQHTSARNHRIPHTIIFTHRTDLLGPHAEPKDLKFFDNIVHTIRKYTNAFYTSYRNNNNNNIIQNHTAAIRPRVWFLDNQECLTVIQAVEPRLVKHFLKEKVGKYQGDVCRAAALYLSGGYYFDVDMKVIQPVHLRPETTFATAQAGDKLFFNSYMAASPRNPILYDSLQIFLRYYEQVPFHGRSMDGEFGVQRVYDEDLLNFSSYIKTARSAVREMINNGLIGPFALKAAYDYRFGLTHSNTRRSKSTATAATTTNNNSKRQRVGTKKKHNSTILNEDESIKDVDAEKEEPVWNVEVLFEDMMGNNEDRKAWYPHLQYQDEGIGCCCNYIVHSKEQRKPYFYSRMIGAGDLCEKPEWATQDARDKKARELKMKEWIESQAEIDEEQDLGSDDVVDFEVPRGGSYPNMMRESLFGSYGGSDQQLPEEEWQRQAREEAAMTDEERAAKETADKERAVEQNTEVERLARLRFANWTWAERKERLPTNVEYFHLPSQPYASFSSLKKKQKRLG